MKSHPFLLYSKSQIAKAGDILGKKIPADSDAEQVLGTFRIAHAWRDAHKIPLTRIRQELSLKAGKLQGKVTTAGRIKRMQSIRQKLGLTRKGTSKLTQLEDLGGCRAILPSMKDVNALIDIYSSGGTRHFVKRQRAYIEEPKPDGYRSHHLTLVFQSGSDEEIYNGLAIEMQLRTALQHAWATAVEAVGMVRNESLKSGQGDIDWLRLFALMSSEFASIEQQTIVQGTPSDAKDRREELIFLDRKLGAATILENLNQVITHIDMYPERMVDHFLVTYDFDVSTVSVRPYHNYFGINELYNDSEKIGNKNSVLVEVDKVADLKDAYPNYFLDVQLFTEHLKGILSARGQNPVVPRAIGTTDLSWLKDTRNWKPTRS